MTNLRQKRSSNFELLRIVSMIMIMVHHYALHGGYFSQTTHTLTDGYSLLFLEIGGKIGVNCFVLISGYFMATSQFKGKNLVSYFAQTWFYSILFFLLLALTGISSKPLRMDTVGSALFPVSMSEYWFMTAFISLYFCIPILNYIIRHISRKALLTIIIVTVFIWSILPTFSIFLYKKPFNSNNLTWFITLYFIAAYIRLYPHPVLKKPRRHLLFSVLLYISVFCISFLLILLSKKVDYYEKELDYFCSMQTLPVLLCALELFIGFRGMRLRPSRWINTISSTTLGIYLIHDNPYVREFLWDNLLTKWDFSAQMPVFLHCFIVVAVLFPLCALLDLLRQKTIHKWFMNFLDKHWDTYKTMFEKYRVKICHTASVCLNKLFGTQ